MGGGFTISKKRKSDERERLPVTVHRREEEYQQERDGLVPHHAAVVGRGRARAR